MIGNNEELSEYPPNQLVPLIADEHLADFLTTVADTSLDAAIDSGALDGVPAVGLITGMLKAYRGFAENWRIRKLALFLSQVSENSVVQRQEFSDQFRSDRERQDFGGALLVLVERAEDLQKPQLLGRLLAAHVAGAFGSADLLRLSRMVDRCFFEDLAVLQRFTKFGLPPRGSELAAQCLNSVGFLAQAGFDGGGPGPDGEEQGGVMYVPTEYAEWVVTYGLSASGVTSFA